MASTSGDRSAHFSAIERKHGRPVSFWLAELAGLGEAKYAEQVDFLRRGHGFSQAHANALVMHARGSSSSRRFDTPEAFFRSLGGEREATARAVFAAIVERYPHLEAVIAWNQPMLRSGKDYVFGLSAASKHLLIAPWGGITPTVTSLLGGLEANKKTVRVPIGWKVDPVLLTSMVDERLAQLGR